MPRVKSSIQNRPISRLQATHVVTLVQDETTLERLRASMRFILWTWTAYWAGGGLLLLVGGMQDPISVAVALLLVAQFMLILATGALDNPRQPGKLRPVEWLVQRPVYLLVLFVIALGAGSFIPSATNAGLGIFSAVYVAALILAIVRLRRHLQVTATPVFASRADQLFAALGLGAFLGVVLFFDQFSAAGMGWPSPVVAAFNWVQLVFPLVLLVAAQPFREKLKLQRPTFKLRKAQPAPVTMKVA